MSIAFCLRSEGLWGGFIPFISSFYLTLQDILFIGRLVGGFLLAEGAGLEPASPFGLPVFKTGSLPIRDTPPRFLVYYTLKEELSSTPGHGMIGIFDKFLYFYSIL